MEEIIGFWDYFFMIFFQITKYVFVFILITLGVLTLLSLRRFYFTKKVSDEKVNEPFLRKARLILGCSYIILGSGILLNYLIYLLIWIIPDGIIFNLINFCFQLILSNPEIPIDIQTTIYNNYKAFFDIFYEIFAFLSMMALLNFIMSLYYFFNNRSVDKPRSTLQWLIVSIASGILFGFSTCLHFFL